MFYRPTFTDEQMQRLLQLVRDDFELYRLLKNCKPINPPPAEIP
jgi:hypothetical protein